MGLSGLGSCGSSVGEVLLPSLPRLLLAGCVVWELLNRLGMACTFGRRGKKGADSLDNMRSCRGMRLRRACHAHWNVIVSWNAVESCMSWAWVAWDGRLSESSFKAHVKSNLTYRTNEKLHVSPSCLTHPTSTMNYILLRLTCPE